MDSATLTQLNQALLYFKMQQLKTVCKKLELDSAGKKIELIDRITTFLKTGKKLSPPSIPARSKAIPGTAYLLKPQTLMLAGAYINDAATRAFFKALIGNHFHFTAYGIDWLNERWMAGNPPTYGEFAAFWEKERVRRKTQKPNPKEEWAYINFLQDYYAARPNAPKTEATAAWKLKQQEMVNSALRLLERASLPNH